MDVPLSSDKQDRWAYCILCVLGASARNVQNMILLRFIMAVLIAALTSGLVGGPSLSSDSPPMQRPNARQARHNTFSIVAYDPVAKEWGAGTASKVLAVGAGVPWAKAGAGALVTQSSTNPTYGTRGLKLLARGNSAAEVIKLLTDQDKDRDDRQLGIIDRQGNTAHFTGKSCDRWAGAKAGKHYVCLGNLLAGKEVVEAMALTFENASGPLAWRIMDALAAGEKAGGDKRGKQSAAILVVRAGGGNGGLDDRAIDFRVDDHRKPIGELARILDLELPREK
jgi:uncharacterized Ntn-hydrolase superfamily protein